MTCLQGPCPLTIAGHAVNPSLEALARHPCRSRSRDGERARTSKDCRCLSESSQSALLIAIRSSRRLRASSANRTPKSDQGCELAEECADPLSVGYQPTVWRGVLTDCGTVGGMDAAIEPPWTGLRRVPQAVRASPPRPTERLPWYLSTSITTRPTNPPRQRSNKCPPNDQPPSPATSHPLISHVTAAAWRRPAAAPSAMHRQPRTQAT